MIATLFLAAWLIIFILIGGIEYLDFKTKTITCRCGQCQMRAAIVFDDAEVNDFATTLTTNCPVCIERGIA